MKKIIVAYLLVVVGFGCNKEDKLPKAEAKVGFNGEQWEAKACWAYKSDRDVSKLTIRMGFEAHQDYVNGLTLYNLTPTIGRQILKPTNYDSLGLIYATYTSSQEEDVTGDEYKVVESDSLNNWVNITSAKDDFTKDIYGEFSVTMVRKKSFPNSPFPDTVRFRNGTFYISKVRD